MNVYTFYTDSHKEIFDLFEEYFYKNSDTKLKLIVSRFEQECPSATHKEHGWSTTMKRKVECILNALQETPENEWFVYTDCDILLFQGWMNVLNSNNSNFDIIIQNDFISLCAGFFFCKSNNKTKQLWQDVYNSVERFGEDQTALNFFLKQSKTLKIAILPESYFTYGLLNKSVWQGTETFEIPSNIKMFHANWTEGTNNKIKLMKLVISLYEYNQITFIIPSINRNTLNRSIDSLINQTDSRWKALVIYDGVEGKNFLDSRITTMTIPKTGHLKSDKWPYHGEAGLVRNIGIKKSNTKWIGFLDDDDSLHRDYVKTLFKKYANYDFVVWRMTTDWGGISPPINSNKIEYSKVGISFCYQNKFNDILFEKNSNGEDFELLQKLQKATSNFVITPEVYYNIRH